MDYPDLSPLIDRVALERGLPRDRLIDALEAAMAVLCRRVLEEGAVVSVRLVDAQPAFEAVRRWEVVADDSRLDDPARQLRLMDALDLDGQVGVGGEVIEPLAVPALTRVGARLLYQQLVDQVRQSERALAAEAWGGRVGEMITGAVKRVVRGTVVLDVDGVEVDIGLADQIPGERLRVGSRVRAVLTGLNEGPRGAVLVASRRDDRLLSRLLELEVPEVGQGVVRVRAVARDGSGRAKVAVQSLDARVDPVGACIGMRGCRIQAVSEALGGERVDLVVFSEDPAQMVVQALAPARVVRLVVDEAGRCMDVAVAEGEVGLALGRGGQNVRLASRLTGWALEVSDEAGQDAKIQARTQAAAALFTQTLDMDEEMALVLVEEGFEDLETLAFIDVAELLAVAGVDESLAAEIQARAQAALEARDARERQRADPDAAWWQALAHDLRAGLEAMGLACRQDVAECAADELAQEAGLDPEAVSALVMDARGPWLEALAA